MDTWMSDQIEEKVEELANGAAPGEIKGSTTVRVAVGLIVGKCLTNTEFSDKQAWEMLDETQKRVVVQHRPKSKYARWFKKEQELWNSMADSIEFKLLDEDSAA